MKKFAIALISAASMLAASSASADVMTNLTATYASGATFNGQLTFSDNYASLLDVNGTLSGGAYGSVNIDWAWYTGTGQGGSQNADSDPATVEDWMMDGTPGNWNYYIGLSWMPGQSSVNFVLSPNTGIYHAGINQNDAAVSYSTNAVPEPGSLALLGLGLLGMGALRRRKA